MKRCMIVLLMVAIIQGCVHTSFKTESGTEFNRWAVLYPFKTGGFEFDPNTGFITLLDYNTDGGGENLAMIFEAGFKAGFKAAGAAL